MLTAHQTARLAAMTPEDAAGWAMYYEDQNRAAERKVAAVVIAADAIEPADALRASGLGATAFVAAVRFLKRCGAVVVTEDGMLAAG
jgi:hypothetical protein